MLLGSICNGVRCFDGRRLRGQGCFLIVAGQYPHLCSAKSSMISQDQTIPPQPKLRFLCRNPTLLDYCVYVRGIHLAPQAVFPSAGFQQPMSRQWRPAIATWLSRYLGGFVGTLQWSNPASEDLAECPRLHAILGIANTHYLAMHERELENPA